MAKALMIQGTCSGAGKSLLVAGLCRIFSDMGIRVAPYKSQNMALNSFVTRNGGEIGRAQALQAEASRIESTTDINPILLKARGEQGCQVIIDGRVHANMTAKEYYSFKDEGWRAATGAYAHLSQAYDLIVIEGAGSPAEINLMNEEIVNMRVARHTGAPVLLVGDIDRGGIFASFYGTLGLLDGDAKLIKGFVVNKFRGDVDILRPGLEQIYGLTGVPVVGVVPYVRDIGLDEEDGLAALRFTPRTGGACLRVAVPMLKYISNFTDFDPLRFEPDVELVFTANAGDIENAHLVMLPGSKNTIQDLLYLRESGLEAAIKRVAGRGTPVIGLCGGYQMMGRLVADPNRIEGETPEAPGMGLLDIETEILTVKTTAQTAARVLDAGFYPQAGNRLTGYEIHMGASTGDVGLFELERVSDGSKMKDGSRKGSAWGTYLHGIFDNDGFRRAVLDEARAKHGLPLPSERLGYHEIKERNLDRWAALLRESLDMDFIGGLV
jgi:adenosylcobyric acid synthase